MQRRILYYFEREIGMLRISHHVIKTTGIFPNRDNYHHADCLVGILKKLGLKSAAYLYEVV